MKDLWKNAQWIFADVKGEVKDRYFEYTQTFEARLGWIPLLSNSHSKTCSLEALKCQALSQLLGIQQ